MKLNRFGSLLLLTLTGSCALPADSEPSPENTSVSEAVTSPGSWLDRHLPPDIKSIVDVAKDVTAAYSGVVGGVEVGIKVLQMIGVLKAAPTQQELIDQLRANIEQIVIASAWNTDTHFYADRLGPLIQSLNAVEGALLDGRPMFTFGSSVDLNSGNAVSAAEVDEAAFTRLLSKSSNVTNGEWQGVISERPAAPNDNVYDWRVGVPALMQMIAMRLQIMAAIEPNFQNSSIYDPELLRHQSKLEMHMQRILDGNGVVGGVKCNSKPLGEMHTSFPRRATRIACADINTGVQAWQDLPASVTNEPGCAVENATWITDANTGKIVVIGAIDIAPSCIAGPKDALLRNVLSKLPLTQLRGMIDTLAVYRDPALKGSTVTAACQAKADQYGIAGYGGFGSAPSDVQTWWMKSGCGVIPTWLERARRAPRLPADFTRDGKAELSVFRPSTREWFTLNTDPWSALPTVVWGGLGSVPVPGDYNGDGSADRAAFEAHNGEWSWLEMRKISSFPPISLPTIVKVAWGTSGDIPVPGDYDGDRKTDLAVWRPSGAIWYIRPGSGAATYEVQWGAFEDTPVIGDYDGDGRTDQAVWRPSDGTWYMRGSRTNTSWSVQWGVAGDVPTPADYDGDGKTDQAVWRRGVWYALMSSTNTYAEVGWGEIGDIPMPADYDGDRKADIAIFRPRDGSWWISQSASNTGYYAYWGQRGDVPIP